jgi:hypothetical protein
MKILFMISAPGLPPGQAGDREKFPACRRDAWILSEKNV